MHTYTYLVVCSQVVNGRSLEGHGWTSPLSGGRMCVSVCVCVCVCLFVTQPQVSGSEFLTHTHTQRGDEIIKSDYDWQTVHHTDTNMHTHTHTHTHTNRGHCFPIVSSVDKTDDLCTSLCLSHLTIKKITLLKFKNNEINDC